MLTRIDPLPLAAAGLTYAVVLLYLVLVHQENGDPTLWAVGVLTAAGAGAIYATRRSSRGRRLVLWPSGATLLFLGYVTIFSIGLPLMLAGALCVASALRARPHRDWRDRV